MASKGSCCQVWQPEFDPWDLCDGRTEPTPAKLSSDPHKHNIVPVHPHNQVNKCVKRNETKNLNVQREDILYPFPGTLEPIKVTNHDLVKKLPGWFDLCWPESEPCQRSSIFPLHCLLKVGSQEFKEEVKVLGHKVAQLIGCLVSTQPIPGCNIQNHINQAWWSVTEISALRSWGQKVKVILG